MSIFGNIASKIFGHHTTSASAAPGSTPSVPGSTASTGAGATPGAGKPISRAEVDAMIEKLAAADHEDYNWKQSIVDLMKLLKLDSSLTARKQLAQELGWVVTGLGAMVLPLFHVLWQARMMAQRARLIEHVKANPVTL